MCKAEQRTAVPAVSPRTPPSTTTAPTSQLQINPVHRELSVQTNGPTNPFHYINPQLMVGSEVSYNESKLRSLRLSSELIDLRLAASRYASAFSTFRPFRGHDLSLSPLHTSAMAGQQLMPALGHKFYEHLMPGYDTRALLMLPTMSNMLGTGTTNGTNSLTSSWVLSNLVSSRN